MMYEIGGVVSISENMLKRTKEETVQKVAVFLSACQIDTDAVDWEVV